MGLLPPGRGREPRRPRPADEAQASGRRILELNPGYDLATAASLTPYPADPALTARYLADLRRAGLPGTLVSDAAAPR